MNGCERSCSEVTLEEVVEKLRYINYALLLLLLLLSLLLLLLLLLNGMTYMIDKIGNIVSYNFNENVAAFCAGPYGPLEAKCELFMLCDFKWKNSRLL